MIYLPYTWMLWARSVKCSPVVWGSPTCQVQKAFSKSRSASATARKMMKSPTGEMLNVWMPSSRKWSSESGSWFKRPK